MTKKWVLKFIKYALSVIIFVSAFNFIVNPYKIFSHPFDLFWKVKTNILSDRMSKFYEEKHSNPSTILMGTSRSGFFTEQQLHPYVQAPIYNYSMAGSSVDEQAAYLRYVLEHQHPKTIIWSLDFFTFNPTKTINPAFDINRLQTPIFLNDYYVSLYSFKTLSRSFKTLKKNLLSKIDPLPYGQPYTPQQVDFNIKYVLHQYASEKSFLNSSLFKEPHSIDPKLALVKQTLDLCHQYNVECILYTSPVFSQHIDMIYAMGLGNTFEYWKKSLAHIAPYTDFCTTNSITTNAMNFTDSSHIVSDFGTLVFAKLFHDQNVYVPNDFGIQITPENINHHLRGERLMRRPFVFEMNTTSIKQ